MTDIKGISLSIVQHWIHLTEEAKPKRDPQCRLNPIMQEAVWAEIVKLLDNGIVYSIFDSQWVSPVHAVPKKEGSTVVENDKKELVQLVFQWRFESVLITENWTLPYVKITSLFHS